MISKFYVVGISYKKADSKMRGKFSLSANTKNSILKKADSIGVNSLMVISTCNRTEIYGFAKHPFVLIKLLCDFSNGSVGEFEKIGYVYKYKEAIEHVLKVASGLDSQILGDFEIISQIKKDFKISKDLGLTDSYLDRLINISIQSSKRVKNETKLSSGVASVAYAATHYIMNNSSEIENKKILLYGLGKIGINSCENLKKHIKSDNIYVINRTLEKSKVASEKFGFKVEKHENLREVLKETDILVVATGAQIPTITNKDISVDKDMLILDLSIPRNVDHSLSDRENIQLIDVDLLSKEVEKNINGRRKYIPDALEIIDAQKEEFFTWLDTRKFSPSVKKLKENLIKIGTNEIHNYKKKNPDFDENQAEIMNYLMVKKITSRYASYLKSNISDTNNAIEIIENIFDK